MAIGKFYLPSGSATSGITPTTTLFVPTTTVYSPQLWQRPADWPDISAVNDNEINLLVGEGAGFAFNVTVLNGGTYSVDYGDGIIETDKASGIMTQHQYTTSSTGGTLTTAGSYVYKVRIYDATYNITIFSVDRHTYSNRLQYQPYLWAVLGTTAITDHSSMFYTSAGVSVYLTQLQSVTIPSFSASTSAGNIFFNCFSLEYVSLPSSWGNVTSTFQMFRNCSSLRTVTLPTTWDKVTNTGSMFNGCNGLSYVTLPTTWGSGHTATNSMFAGCNSLETVKLPTSWGTITNAGYMFQLCYNLAYITIPTGTSITNASNMFVSCYSLKTINNFELIGSKTTQSDFTAVLRDCEFLQQNILIDATLSAFGAYGATGYNLKLTSVRLTNTGSTFGGTSPQVNVSYTSLDATALDLLFGDLPTLASKTIDITGSLGATGCTRTIATGKGWTVTG